MVMSGLYNVLHGYNQACVFILPMLGRKMEEYPRFRDCFVDKETRLIAVFTRVGGGNRDCGMGEEELYDDPNFVSTCDAEYDSTYGYYYFKVPEKWKSDFDLILAGKLQETSEDYVQMVTDFYPDHTEMIMSALRGH